MDLQFVNPWILYLLWLVPALAAWWIATNRRTEQRLGRFVSPAMQAKLAPTNRTFRFAWQAGVVAAGTLLLLIAAARPQWGSREEVVFQQGRDLVIALDVSRSMLANDVHPNRLERAKADILDLIKEIPGDRVALLAFRRTGILLCPLTTDYAYLRQALEAVGTDSAPRGETDIGDAIDKAMQAFESDDASHKAIILISDGDDLSGRAVAMAEKAGEKGIPIFTVGIGNRKGSSIPSVDNPAVHAKYRDADIVTKLNDEVLYSIANKTGGAYLPIETASMGDTTLGTLYNNHLSKVSGRELEETRLQRRIERFQWFLLPGILLLLAGCFLSRGRLATGRNPKDLHGGNTGGGKPAGSALRYSAKATIPMIIMAGLFVTLAAHGQTNSVSAAGTNATATVRETPHGRNGARLAQKLYMVGKYDEAAQAYLDASASAAGKPRSDYRYNAAVSLFKAGKYKEAADLLKEVSLAAPAASLQDAYMALGTSLFKAAEKGSETNEVQRAQARERNLRDAGESFKEVARAGSDNEKARKNLGVVLDQLPEAEERALFAGLLEKYGQAQAGSIANEMLLNQRNIAEEAGAAFSNATPARIYSLEDLAKKEKENANLWIPLKGKLMAEIAQQPNQTNAQQQAAYVNQMAEMTRAQMLGGANAMRDLDPEAARSFQASEAAIYRLWREVAPYPLVLQEDLYRQSNTMTSTTSLAGQDANAVSAIKANQDEATHLTRLFVDRFQAAVPESGSGAMPQNAGQQNPSPGPDMTSTNQEGQISAEDRKKILELAEQAIQTQTKASSTLEGDRNASLDLQKESYRILKEIEKLLPKQKNQQQQQKEDQKEQKSEQKEQQQPQDQAQEDKQEKKEPQQAEQKEPQDEDTKKLLEKALQREKDHEAEKRRMMNRYVPPSSIERDW